VLTALAFRLADTDIPRWSILRCLPQESPISKHTDNVYAID
jgi:hypothetical protein